jgi:hypothetical protein
MKTNPLVVAVIVMVLLSLVALLGIAVTRSVSDVQYCDSKYLAEDLELVGDMNVCMATVACNFQRSDVRLYRQAVKLINMCSEKAKIEAIPEPYEGRP